MYKTIQVTPFKTKRLSCNESRSITEKMIGRVYVIKLDVYIVSLMRRKCCAHAIPFLKQQNFQFVVIYVRWNARDPDFLSFQIFSLSSARWIAPRGPHHTRCMPAKRIRQLANACNGAPPLFLERFSDSKEIKFYHPSKTGTRQNAAKSIHHGIQGIVLKQETVAIVNDAAGK